MPNRWLESDGSNLGLILNRFQRNPPAKKRLLTALRKLYDGIEDFGVLIEGGTRANGSSQRGHGEGQLQEHGGPEG